VPSRDERFVVKQSNGVWATVGVTGVAVGVIGASTAAVTVGTVVVATAAAAALALAGVGLYKRLSGSQS
jgi:hypothetical protein